MKKSVLFLCTGNSARSLMAEALLRSQADHQFDVYSAGTHPAGIDQQTLLALESFGISTQRLTSKSIESLGNRSFDFVITLCSKARQECRQWPDSGVVVNWDFPDPKQSRDPLAFRRTLQEIAERVRLFVLVNSQVTATQVKTPSPLEFYKCLAEETRLLSLALIEEAGELCVCDLVQALAQPQPKISRHLAQLRSAGLLLDRRQGQWVHYRLHPLLPDWMRDVLHQTRTHNPQLLQAAHERFTPPGQQLTKPTCHPH